MPPAQTSSDAITEAARLENEDLARLERPFLSTARPLVRWIMRASDDDEAARLAIRIATDTLGDTTDYCLCAGNLPAARARALLSWALQPVEWVSSANAAEPDRIPVRLRPLAPEWVLSSNSFILRPPPWYDAWLGGSDHVRLISADRRHDLFASLPPRQPANRSAMFTSQADLNQEPYDGPVDYVESALFPACSSEALVAITPNYDNQFGFHLVANKSVPAKTLDLIAARLSRDRHDEDPKLIESFVWLRNHGQWGVPGWSMQPSCIERIVSHVESTRPSRTLDLGTSRGLIAAIVASLGCKVTTVDIVDRGAAQNLEGLNVEIVISDADDFLLARNQERFPLIIADFHNNSAAVWEKRWPLVERSVAAHGTAILYNTHLWQQERWRDETGLRWLTERTPTGWRTEIYPDPWPGMAICYRL